MPKEVPHFNNEAIAHLAMELYGIEGEISALVSYEDQNARIKTSDGTYVLKIANAKWAADALAMQTEVLEHLRTVAPELSLPRVIPTLSGETITDVDGFAVRLVTFLEGDVLGNASRSPGLYHDIGCFMGQFSQAMQAYTHPAAHRPDDPWNLDNVIVCKAYLQEVCDENVRARIERFYEMYEKNVLPRLHDLRKSVIHGDANEHNLLVSPDRPRRIQLTSATNEFQKRVASG
ncbi:MAG: phosphotransferase [Planctomycetes bacterium]|nr:phosphotransferase [Planctomycetota bacterium]